jgi:recombinational DNA repair protein (RecF pathway)
LNKITCTKIRRVVLKFFLYIGYGWQICTCCKCRVHIGWKYTSVKSSLKPDKFWGLTRNAIRYTYDDASKEVDSNDKEMKEIKTDLQSID